jgi:hypothetical protein
MYIFKKYIINKYNYLQGYIEVKIEGENDLIDWGVLILK